MNLTHSGTGAESLQGIPEALPIKLDLADRLGP